MTGGETRVANLRDGLFGPTDKPGDNRRRVFGEAAKYDGGPLIAVDDWASHYVAWMGLGGTSRAIPQGILSTVANTPVLGTLRSVRHFDPPSSANMLQTAQQLCAHVLGVAKFRGDILFDVRRGEIDHADAEGGTALITTNGDAAMWESLCRIGNPMPVRVIRRTALDEGRSAPVRDSGARRQWYRRAAYRGSPIGDITWRVMTPAGGQRVPVVSPSVRPLTPQQATAGPRAGASAPTEANSILPGEPLRRSREVAHQGASQADWLRAPSAPGSRFTLPRRLHRRHGAGKVPCDSAALHQSLGTR